VLLGAAGEDPWQRSTSVRLRAPPGRCSIHPCIPQNWLHRKFTTITVASWTANGTPYKHRHSSSGPWDFLSAWILRVPTNWQCCLRVRYEPTEETLSLRGGTRWFTKAHRPLAQRSPCEQHSCIELLFPLPSLPWTTAVWFQQSLCSSTPCS